MKKRNKFIFMFFLVFFTIMLGTGISFMQYHMLNPNMNLALTMIGLVGLIVCTVRYIKN